MKCASCGLIFLDHFTTIETVSDDSLEYFSAPAQTKRSFMSRHPLLRRLYHGFAGEYLAFVLSKASGRVLEVGCGFGDLLAELKDAGKDVAGVEINPAAVDFCRKRGLDVRCGTLESAQFPAESFDTAIMWHVIEHVPFPVETLKNILKTLKPGGKLYLYCPNVASYCGTLFGDAWMGWDPPRHLSHFTPETLCRTISASGFKLISITTASPEYISMHSLDRAFQMGKLPRWLPSARLFNRLPARFGLMFVLRIMDLVMPGKGDCLRAELVK